MEALKIGSTGKAVKELQEKLNQLKGINYLKVDGDYGIKTSVAVTAFQKKHGLEVDGIAGSKTQTKLNEVYNELFPEAKSLRERLECHLKDAPHSMALPPKGFPVFNLNKGYNDLIHQIVEFFDVENNPYYQKKERNGIINTYCNVYAYHFCWFLWFFLPRVWWDKKTFERILAGETIEPVYPIRGKVKGNVGELTANALFDWLNNEGIKYFGWERVDTPEEFQQAVNNGAGGVICAKRHNLKRSGHIAPGIPEDKDHKMVNGVPLQSQAGWNCWNYHNKPWYLSDKFKEYGFFVNRQPKS